MRYWFIPCQSGDFRLHQRGAVLDACVLSVENTTEEDRQRLRPFLAEAESRGWIPHLRGFNLDDVGPRELVIQAPLVEAGVLLSQQVFPDEDSWTAVRWTDGRVDLADDASAALVQRIRGQEGTKPQALVFTAGVGSWATPVAAVTTPRPKIGCPEPEPCARRPFQVLQAFSTQSQVDSFRRFGRLDAYGSVTGARYSIFHRDTAARRGLSRTIVNGVGNPVCAWLRDVPPEEEVLALKLTVEHREQILLDPGVQRQGTLGLSSAWV